MFRKATYPVIAKINILRFFFTDLRLSRRRNGVTLSLIRDNQLA
jgi:hypothetical protein